MTDSAWLTPAFAYIPGQTPRPPEDWADAVCATARPGMSAAELADSPAFLHGLRYIEQGFFWEAHEVLEPVWMALPEKSEERRFVQGLIQLANACLKQRMGRRNAVSRLCGIARSLLPDDPAAAMMRVRAGWALERLTALEQGGSG